MFERLSDIRLGNGHDDSELRAAEKMLDAVLLAGEDPTDAYEWYERRALELAEGPALIYLKSAKRLVWVTPDRAAVSGYGDITQGTVPILTTAEFVEMAKVPPRHIKRHLLVKDAFPTAEITGVGPVGCESEPHCREPVSSSPEFPPV